jgi:uncharacterized protein YggE
MSSPPQVIASATGEATLIPDRATLMLAVETRAQTASAAGAANARLQQSVIAAIVSKGIRGEQISTAGYNLHPNERYSPEGQRTLLGYIARNTIAVRLERIDQVGPVIDAALGAGANVVSGLRLYSSKFEEVRRTALQEAVRKAREDAQVLATAAGGTLGAIIELQTTDGYGPRPMYEMAVMSAARAAADTPVVAGEQTVTVTVTTRWSLNPGR